MVMSEWNDPNSTKGELSSLIARIEKETNGIGDTTTKVETWAEGLEDGKKQDLKRLIDEYHVSKSRLNTIITGDDGLNALAQELPYGDQNHINQWNTFFNEGTIILDRVYPEIENEDRIVLVWQDVSRKRALFRVTSTGLVSTSLFNLPATVTRLTITRLAGDPWKPTIMEIIRSTTVYAGGELIINPVSSRVLAEEPLQEKDTYLTQEEQKVNVLAAFLDVSVGALMAANEKTIKPEDDRIPGGIELLLPLGKKLELDKIYCGLKPGRWITVTGMRADIPVIGREVALLQSVEHRFAKRADNTDLPGDLRHTFLTLTTALKFPYMRSSVKINANVVPATHGETARGLPPDERDVILGSADSSLPHQSFSLGLSPGKRLTFVSAPTRDGVKSTLQVYVNNIRWHPVDTFINSTATDHAYVVHTEEDGQTSILFGDGCRGARPPTGRENVFAHYRVGIGKDGNVKAGQISLLATRPLGVKEVANSIAASGGTDPEDRDQARGNVKFSVRTLDRLVGLTDYEDFACTFGGIGKARAGYDPAATDDEGKARGKVTIYVAGENNAPLDQDGELIQNLRKALDEYDGSDLLIDTPIFTPRLLILDATVSISPDYLWEKVQPEIRTALEKSFAFARRELGQTVALSEVIATIQQVEGVAHVRITRFDALTIEQLQAVAGNDPAAPIDRYVVPALISLDDPRQSQLIYIDPSVPSLIALREPQADAVKE